MWLSLNIVSKIVDIKGLTPEEIALRLTMATAEIDSIEYVNKHLASVITARALDVKPHPNADKLTLVDVDTGKEKLHIVCGATNQKKGDIVALAPVGTKFSEEFEIKKTKIRGEDSCGMLCSEKELGFSDEHTGILILPNNTPLGVPLSELYDGWYDVRLEIDNKSITHRPDLWSHMGFAREIGALFGRAVKDPVDYSVTKTFKDTEKLTVSIQNPAASPRYCGLVVKNITIKESPEWLKASVTAIGMRPINNIVDITNYVMAEIGEPMHAFDRKKLRGNEIIVRMAREGEELVTLDGSKYNLIPEDIVIADREGAIALAGVMGGGNSEIEDSTTEIVLEAANFNPVNIRKTSGRYSQRTEAAIRFEKAISAETAMQAIVRCYELIKKVLPEAEAVSPVIDAYPVKQKEISIRTTTAFLRTRLGENINDARIIEILTALDFGISMEGEELSIKVPHYRATKDISIPEDIVEEIGRIYGYDNIKPYPAYVPCTTPARNEFRIFERTVKDLLSMHCNMIEVSGYSFVGADDLTKLKINEDKELRLKNPLSQEQDRLRRSLIPGLVKMISVNQRFNEEFQIYELGRVYLKDDRTAKDLISENTRASGVFFKRKTKDPLFYDAKNAVVTVLEKLSIAGYRLLPETKDLPSYAHPGRSMKLMIGNKAAGLIFELHPLTAEACDCAGRAAFFDLDLNMIYSAKKIEKKFDELQKFPEVPFELSVLAERLAYADDICRIIRSSDQKHIKGVDVIATYEGAPVPEGKKSVSIKMIFAAKDKTFAPDEIDSIQKKVIADLGKAGYQLR